MFSGQDDDTDTHAYKQQAIIWQMFRYKKPIHCPVIVNEFTGLAQIDENKTV